MGCNFKCFPLIQCCFSRPLLVKEVPIISFPRQSVCTFLFFHVKFPNDSLHFTNIILFICYVSWHLSLWWMYTFISYILWTTSMGPLLLKIGGPMFICQINLDFFVPNIHVGHQVYISTILSVTMHCSHELYICALGVFILWKIGLMQFF